MSNSAKSKRRNSFIPERYLDPSYVPGSDEANVESHNSSEPDAQLGQTSNAEVVSGPEETRVLKPDDWKSVSDTLMPAALNPSILRREDISGGNGALRSTIGAIQREVMSRKQYEDLMVELTKGDVIVELVPGMIDGSFVRDRMSFDQAQLDQLKKQIEEQGQLVPILVRPHPTEEGRFQTAYGHRRIRACHALGKRVRAVVRNLSDEELVIAQGQENTVRENLSFIERARFARTLNEREMPREVIAAALGISSKSLVSQFLTILAGIPDPIVEAIGSAPSVGRGRWEELSKLISASEARESLAFETIDDPSFGKKDTSDDRFEFVLTRLKKYGTAKPPSVALVSNELGEEVVKCVERRGQVVFEINSKVDPKFGQFLQARMSELYEKYKQEAAEISQ